MFVYCIFCCHLPPWSHQGLIDPMTFFYQPHLFPWYVPHSYIVIHSYFHIWLYRLPRPMQYVCVTIINYIIVLVCYYHVMLVHLHQAGLLCVHVHLPVYHNYLIMSVVCAFPFVLVFYWRILSETLLPYMAMIDAWLTHVGTYSSLHKNIMKLIIRACDVARVFSNSQSLIPRMDCMHGVWAIWPNFD